MVGTQQLKTLFNFEKSRFKLESQFVHYSDQKLAPYRSWIYYTEIFDLLIFFELQSFALFDPSQCDQIGRLFILWATCQSPWQQLFCPNCRHILSIFVNLSKSLILLAKSFLGNFYRHLVTFHWSHWSLFNFSLFLRSDHELALLTFELRWLS